MADGFSELTVDKLSTAQGISELNRMLAFLFAKVAGDGEAVNVITGVGSPSGVVAANVGSLYLRTNGGASTTLYVKESGTDASGWRAV